MKIIKVMLIVATALLSILSCSKEESNDIQAHDENRMMDSLHAMMAKMEAMPKTNDPEIDFPAMMVMHHQGAIDVATIQTQEGKDDSLKRISQKMIAAQQMEIQKMKTILLTQTVNNSVPAFTMEQMDHMKKMDQMADIQFITGDLDNDFATLMIQHHNSAIENSETYLMYGNNEALKTMAIKMVADQKKEIKELSDWLKANKR